MERSFLSDQEKARLLREVLPLQDALVLSARSWIPFRSTVIGVFVWCDLADRPDVRACIRVHARGGEGDAELTWMVLDLQDPPASQFLLRVQALRPVRATFTLAIPVNEWSRLLKILARTGVLTVLPGPPLNWRDLLPQLGPKALLREIDRRRGAGFQIDFKGTTQTYLRELYRQWAVFRSRSGGR